jgi:hypothetical protein
MSSPIDETPVQTLRRAATLMRERAAMATPGPWRNSEVDGNRYAALVADRPHPDRMKNGGWDWDEGYGGCLIGESLMSSDRRYIAAMHPGVALAAAAMLDDAAENAELQAPNGDLRAQWDMRIHIATKHALAFARAYLGESS